MSNKFKILVGLAVLMLGIGTIYQVKKSSFNWLSKSLEGFKEVKVVNLASNGLSITADSVTYSNASQPLLSLALEKVTCQPSITGFTTVGLGCLGTMLDGKVQFSSFWPSRRLSLDIRDFQIEKHPTAALLGLTGGKGSLFLNDIKVSDRGGITSGTFRLTVLKISKSTRPGRLTNLMMGIVPDMVVDEIVADAQIETEERIKVSKVQMKSTLGNAIMSGSIDKINSTLPIANLSGTISLTNEGVQKIGMILAMNSPEGKGDRFSIKITGPLARANVQIRPL